jgi:hypothetical protein
MNSVREFSIIHERSNIIPIPKSLITSPKANSRSACNNYSLKQNFFDPTKSSPPNDFMLKLQERMNIYEGRSLGINDSKRDRT